MHRFLATVLVFMLAKPAFAQVYVLTTSDFDRREVNVNAIEGDQLVLADDETVALGEVLRLEREVRMRPAGGAWRLVGRTGERYVGEPVALEEETLVFAAGRVGEVRVPLAEVRSLTPVDGPLLPGSPGDFDVVTLANGDVVRGILVNVTADEVELDRDGQLVSLALDDVVGVQVASLGETERRQGWHMTILDGTVAFIETPTLESGTLSYFVAGRDGRMPMGNVVALEQINGPVVYLAMLPFEEQQTPYLGAAAPARIGESVDGTPIRVDGAMSRRSLGVHSRSELTFDVPEGYRLFKARYAVAGSLPLADAAVRVLVDGEEAFTDESLQAGQIGDIEVDFSGAKTLTLVVDYGANLDTQDRVNWLEPVLVK